MRKIKYSSLAMAVCVAFAALLLLFPEPAHAGYLDPGSGSSLIQGIIATIAGIRRFFGRIFSIFGGKKA